MRQDHVTSLAHAPQSGEALGVSDGGSSVVGVTEFGVFLPRAGFGVAALVHDASFSSLVGRGRFPLGGAV